MKVIINPRKCKTGQRRIAQGDTVVLRLSRGGHWYGHGFAGTQAYPLEQGSLSAPRFAVNNIQSPVWMCSAGVVFLAQTTEILDIRINENKDGLLKIRCDGASFQLNVFKASNLPKARALFLKSMGLKKRKFVPALLGDSIFCTWTQYPRCINQKRILDMAYAIRQQGYPATMITIDDRWESDFGDLDFSKDFPDARRMIASLHNQGFKVLLWTTPFVNTTSLQFKRLSQKGWLVREKGKSTPALFRWWAGTAGLVDLTLPDAYRDYQSRLKRLQTRYGVDGFKIDGGDYKYQPDAACSDFNQTPGPSGFADILLRCFEEIAPNLCETRAAWLSHQRKILWRQGGKDSVWGMDNGMRAMVHLGLHMALMGYDPFIPDMIPGRVQTLVSGMPLPTDEFFVRWVEVSAFMPIVQFSYFPWNYGPDVAQISLAYAELHKTIQSYLSRHAGCPDAPLFQPLFFADPSDKAAYKIGDEFLLGPDLLVVPVFEPGKTNRKLYIPKGKWLDARTGRDVKSGWHKNYPAPCPGIPVFVRAGNRVLSGKLLKAFTQIKIGVIPSGLTTSTYQAGLDRDLSVTG